MKNFEKAAMQSYDYAHRKGVEEVSWERFGALGAARVITASLVCHSWADPAPDQVALVTDALVLFPWDRHVYVDGAWQIHPELRAALIVQGSEP